MKYSILFLFGLACNLALCLVPGLITTNEKCESKTIDEGISENKVFVKKSVYDGKYNPHKSSKNPEK